MCVIRREVKRNLLSPVAVAGPPRMRIYLLLVLRIDILLPSLCQSHVTRASPAP